ncbi:A/G-specific adenine glycosylase [Sphingomonas turrisvirgatae]|uniref:Adenine DNA glycosylase n=1 Tax=Sphingomonas turrisvirgatae TaxID=1888892 RepID=A0A1E3M0D4_9SPHN|nr:A/G-specific adenine glycosylase [Sphingomonas turrisvirgatae]ODP39547.1 A/G-specific adenine glycosylase [Sphingomonas turrisvirgatae]
MPDNASRDIAAPLLAWYDANARVLPWRAPPGTPPPDPYRVWLSEVMLQQTQVATVIPYFEKFLARWPDFASLAAADDAELMTAWAGLGYYARARNLLAAARAVADEHGGKLPASEAELRKLPGFGAYTAAAVSAIAFGERAVVVDGNVERVIARLFALSDPLPGAKPRIRVLTDSVTPVTRAGDFAQAMMDLGATICTPRSPKCLLCPLADHCDARAQGLPEAYPVKVAKKARPIRHGTMFWAEHHGRVLLVRRPASGLLGGMRALPTGPWTDVAPALDGAPFAAGWTLHNATVSHGFTHFELVSALASVTLDGQVPVIQGEWWPIDDLDSAGLPTVFAKAADQIRRMR